MHATYRHRQAVVTLKIHNFGLDLWIVTVQPIFYPFATFV